MKHALALLALVAALVSGPGSVYRLSAPVAVQVTHCPKPACTRIGPGTHRDRQRPVLDAYAAGVITGRAMVRLANGVR